MTTMTTILRFTILPALLLGCLIGCGDGAGTADKDPGKSGSAAKDTGKVTDAGGVPCFSLAWSEYPSWSTFGVANELHWIDGRKGSMGDIEKKWGVDIELKEAEYDPCITMYGASQCDAVCITNMDVLNPSLSRPSVAIAPTSTSFGADALIVPETIKTVQDLKGKKIYGLAKSVSEYCFARNLELLGEKPGDYTFSNMDPGAAAMAMQQKQVGYDAIIVWNPYVVATLAKRADCRRLFDSTKIPNEIIDMLVVGEDVLQKPKAKEFCLAMLDTFYAVSKRLAEPATREDTLRKLAEKFAKLDLPSMELCVQQTRFFDTPQKGVEALVGATMNEKMPMIASFCVSHEIVPKGKAPTVGYGTKAEAPAVNLRFDPSFMREYMAKP